MKDQLLEKPNLHKIRLKVVKPSKMI